MSAAPSVYVVRLGEVEVGSLERRLEGSEFALSSDYVQMPSRPVLGQVFEEDLERSYHVSQGVPAWFANLLPEGPLKELIARKADVHISRAYFLLGLLGDDLPGAVIVEGAGEPGEESAEEDVVEDESSDEVLKFSLAGVQLKFSVMRGDRGLTVPTEGIGGSWIVKLPDSRFELVPETEYATLLWAKETGIDVPDVFLTPVAEIRGLPIEFAQLDGDALAIQRFDRDAGARVHVEDFAQIRNVYPRDKYAGPNYETLARILSATTRIEDVDEFIRRLVFNVVIGNGDAHLKNWSLIYPDGRTARLAPAYDLLPTYLYVPADDNLALNLNGNKRFNLVRRESFARFADRAHLDEGRVLSVVDDHVGRVVAAWSSIRQEMPSKEFQDKLDQRLAELPLVREVIA